jgi:hypothetical protein
MLAFEKTSTIVWGTNKDEIIQMAVIAAVKQISNCE